MATSSITKNFVVSGEEQAEKFANAIESSYQDSLLNNTEPNLKITYLKNPNEVKEFMAKVRRKNA